MIRSLQLLICPLVSATMIIFDTLDVHAGFLLLGLNDTGSEAVKYDPASTPTSRVANVNPRRLDAHYRVTSDHGTAQSSLPGRRTFTEEATPPEANSVVTHKISKLGARSSKSRMN